MVNVIVAKQKYDCKHLLGQFVDEQHYDVLVEEDCDVYAPPDCDLGTQSTCTSDCETCDKGTNEKKIIFKFRKNYFSKEEQDAAYAGLREAAVESQNRGLAAGPRNEKLGNRDWVTPFQEAVVDYFMNPTANLTGGNPVEEIRQQTKNLESTRGIVWRLEKVKSNNFNFDQWVERMLVATEDVQIEEATWVAKELISDTTYANTVNSGIAGWFDRYPRIPYGRATAYTKTNPEKFAMAYPFLQTLAKGFKELLPWRYGNQMEAAKKLDKRFLVPETPFTTITVNKTFRTAAHYDAGDLDTGLSNLLVLSNGGNYTGGYLIAPEYRVAVNVRPGDLLLINNHEVLHGNTPIVLGDEQAERISLVCYFREKMLELGSWEYEQARFEYVESRRLNKEHPLWRKLWNGVSEGMWEEKEWYDFCEKKVGRDELIKMHPKANAVNLEEFFG
jgi:hypothetical protein